MSDGAVRKSPFLFVEDMAGLLGCSTRTIHERTRLGEIPHRRPPGARRCLFIPDEIRAWIDGAELEVIELERGGRIVRPKKASGGGATS